MVNEEWLEIRARSREDAVEAAIGEFGLKSADEVSVEVVEEPEKGILGLGGKDGLFRVARKEKSSRRRRRRGRGDGRDKNGGKQASKPQSGSGRSSTKSRDGGGTKGKQRASDKPKPKPQPEKKKEPKQAQQTRKEEAADMPDLEEQARVVNDFLVGLLESFGLEGDVDTHVEGEDIIICNVTGAQTEALVGTKGSILQAILELTRTVVQRKTQSGARIRLDIAGYTERRREALKIYATRLAEQVESDGEEVMLEPMNPADRKVVHDAVAEIQGVRSYSEGEEPRRSVVISPALGE